jgi:hypothetical protein
MADTQAAPQAPAGLQPIPALGGSVTEAQEALLSLLEPEEETPETEEAQPTEEEESQPVEEDESFEEESEEEEESVEEEEESEETEGEEEEELYAVTVNGEEVAVSLDELLSGYSRQSDYTRKTQEIANDRKEMETLQQQYNSQMSTIQQERQHYMEALQGIITNSASGLSKYSDIDWDNLKETDPIEFVTKREELRQSQEKVQALQREQYQTQQRHEQEAQKMRANIVQEEFGKLVEKLPEWGEEDKQKEIASSIRSYASTQGFTEEELNSLVDHRSLLVLMKAQKYDQLQKSNVKSKKLKNKPKVIRAGSGTSTKGSNKSKRTAQMKRLRGTGHIDDASALLEDFIDI